MKKLINKIEEAIKGDYENQVDWNPIDKPESAELEVEVKKVIVVRLLQKMEVYAELYWTAPTGGDGALFKYIMDFDLNVIEVKKV